MARDGKTLRGTLGNESQGQPPVHLLSLYECHSGIVLTQRAVCSKEKRDQCGCRIDAFCARERTPHQYGCDAHPKVVVRQCACIWWLLPWSS